MFESARRSLDIYDAKCVPCTIGDYVAFPYSVIDGRTAQEFDSESKPSSQIKALFKYLMKALGEVHREKATA